MLEFFNAKNSSDPDEERVSLKATATVNLKGYAIVDKTFDADGIETDTYRHIFIFPAIKVLEGEFVRLTSGKGTYAKKKNNAGTYTHFFYWNAKSCVWNNKGDTATLIKYSVIANKKISAISK